MYLNIVHFKEMSSIPLHYTLSLFKDGPSLEALVLKSLHQLLTLLCMISKDVTTEASISGVSYAQLQRGYLITGIVGLVKYDCIINKYLY